MTPGRAGSLLMLSYLTVAATFCLVLTVARKLAFLMPMDGSSLACLLVTLA